MCPFITHCFPDNDSALCLSSCKYTQTTDSIQYFKSSCRTLIKLAFLVWSHRQEESKYRGMIRNSRRSHLSSPWPWKQSQRGVAVLVVPVNGRRMLYIYPLVTQDQDGDIEKQSSMDRGSCGRGSRTTGAKSEICWQKI